METKIPKGLRRIIPTRVTRSASKTLEDEERYKAVNEMDVSEFNFQDSLNLTNFIKSYNLNLINIQNVNSVLEDPK